MHWNFKVFINSFTLDSVNEYIDIDVDHESSMSPRRSVGVCVAYPYSPNEETPVSTPISDITKTIKQQGTREQQ